jgi:hypothetical protein
MSAEGEAPAPVEEEGDPLHIGNLIVIVSDTHGYVVGTIVYHDTDLIRVRPQGVSDRAINFPMTADGEFAEGLGVSTIEVVETFDSPYYVDFLGARPGEILEFFKGEGEVAEPVGEVEEVIKTRKRDAIRLTDGRVLNFRARGPPAPIEVIRVRTASNIEAEAAGATAAGEGVVDEATARAARQKELLELLRSAAPIDEAENVPIAEFLYPDGMQREDMFQDLMEELNDKQRRNPRRIRRLEREVDLLMSLKNTSVARDAVGHITGTTPYEFLTINDVIAASNTMIPAAVPIVKAARTLNLDAMKPEGVEDDLRYNPEHVEPRLLADVERSAIQQQDIYLGDAVPADGADAARDFYAFMYNDLVNDQHTLNGSRRREWATDQDVIRTAGLGNTVQGLSAGLFPGHADTDKGEVVSLAHLIADVTDRSIRVLAPTRFTNARTGEETVIAPSDPSEVIGYVILPAKAAISLRPPRRAGEMPMALLYSAALHDDNLPTIAQTLRDLYSPESGETLNAWTLDAASTDKMAIANWLGIVLKYVVHPSDSLGPRASHLLSLLDTIGAGEHNMSDPVAAVINRWVRNSQKIWDDMLKTRREDIQKFLDTEEDRKVQTVTGEDSPLWAALRGAEPLADFMNDIRRRNPTIADAPTLTVASFMFEAQGDAAPLAWGTIAAMDARTIAIDQIRATAALSASRAYALRRKALRDIALLSLRAEPEISTCPHTKQLEAVRNVRDVPQRARLMREFIEQYQGGKVGDWMTCALCAKPCVCYHEIMELEALAQPTRMDAIQKQILIRFGGERYSGKIVCKNCGQGLQEIDYDEHVEFDDDGRPIAQASVLTEDQMADVAEESSAKRAIAELVQPKVAFATRSQQELGDILQIVLERGGLLAPSDVVRQIVRYADLYVSLRAPTQAAYEAFRQKALTSAASRIRTATGASASSIDIQTYDAMIGQLRVVSLGAVLTIALQAAEPQIMVNTPFPLCKFSREGWPLDPAGKPDESGAVRYISCVVGSIQKDMLPWKFLAWAGETKLEARQKKISATLVQAATVILSGDPKTGPLSFTPEIRTLLSKAQTDVEAATRRKLVSHTDQLPASFRPEPFPPKVSAPSIERDPVPGIEAALASGSVGEDMIAEVASAARLQGIAAAAGLHTAAAEGKGSPQDDVCCPTPIADVERGALRGPAAATPLARAQELLRRGIPTAVSAGTHMWSDMKIPIATIAGSTVEPDVFFKLFLKYCYRGPVVGEAHEFSVGDRCRQCGFALGMPATLVDITKDGSAIMAAQQGDLHVEITQAAFDALSDAVRRIRIITPQAPVERREWIDGLRTLITTCRARVEIPEGSRLYAFAAALEEVLGAVAAHPLGEELDDITRATLWEPVVELLDSAREEVGARIGPLVAVGPGQVARARADEAKKALALFDAMTEDPFIEGPRAVQEYWCAKTMGEGKGFHVTEVRPFMPVTTAQWVEMPPPIRERLNKFMRENSQWYAGHVGEDGRHVLRRFGAGLGPLMRTWVKYVRPAPGGASSMWTSVEGQLVLRSMIMQLWYDALTPTSWMYAEIAAAAARDSAVAQLSNWTRALMFHVKQQFFRFTKERIKQILQQRAELERTSIVQEFEGIRDDDERGAALQMMQMRIGRWGKGGNIRDYDAGQLDFEIEQRRRMGVVDATVEQIALEGAGPSAGAAAAAGDFGFGIAEAEAGSAYDVDHAADGDNY